MKLFKLFFLLFFICFNSVIYSNENKNSNQEWLRRPVKNHDDIKLHTLRRSGSDLYSFSKKDKDNYDYVINAVAENGKAIKYASERLKNNYEIAMIAVNNRGESLKYLPVKFRDDFNIVFIAVSNDGNALEYASDRLKNDINIGYQATTYNIYALKYLSENLKKNKHLVLNSLLYLDKEDKDRIKFGNPLIYNIHESLHSDLDINLKLNKIDSRTYDIVTKKHPEVYNKLFVKENKSITYYFLYDFALLAGLKISNILNKEFLDVLFYQKLFENIRLIDSSGTTGGSISIFHFFMYYILYVKNQIHNKSYSLLNGIFTIFTIEYSYRYKLKKEKNKKNSKVNYFKNSIKLISLSIIFHSLYKKLFKTNKFYRSNEKSFNVDFLKLSF